MDYKKAVEDVIDSFVNLQEKHNLLTKSDLTDCLEIFTRAIYSRMENDFRDSKRSVESEFIEAFDLTLDEVLGNG